MRGLTELATIGVQGAEYADLNALYIWPLQHGAFGTAKQVVEQGPFIVKERPEPVWYGKSQSGRTCCCSAIHCSVDFMPQALQAFDVQLWHKKRVWVQPGEARQ